MVPPTGSMDLSLRNIPIAVPWCHSKLQQGRATLQRIYVACTVLLMNLKYVLTFRSQEVS